MRISSAIWMNIHGELMHWGRQVNMLLRYLKEASASKGYPRRCSPPTVSDTPAVTGHPLL